MDAKIDPMDEATHVDLMDLMRRSDFSDAVILFGRLIKLAYHQGQIDAHAATVQRLNDGSARQLEDDVRNIAERRIEQ